MGLCGEVGNIDETKIYGIMPFVAPEVLKGKPYKQAADIYSFVMVPISDMGLCGEVGNIDETKIYGIMPFVAPEVLKGKPYKQAADIYSFGMFMYYVATGRQLCT
ncbi:hypothetical protein C1645_849786 [Glomus cerebriforme]|uniref:Protein kinase domain-containing protein n=1 Tax=Glomus cerebriforme TaxID=658196 RepID=A0A397SVM2_9GLOM|nr:hypothetical protein C1645_849786 [Glomus cerebriforme]